MWRASLTGGNRYRYLFAVTVLELAMVSTIIHFVERPDRKPFGFKPSDVAILVPIGRNAQVFSIRCSGDTNQAHGLLEEARRSHHRSVIMLGMSEAQG